MSVQDSPTKYDLVVLSKIDKDGNISLVHNKPLHLDLLNQVPDSIISFSEGFKIILLKSVYEKLFINVFFLFQKKRHHLCLNILSQKTLNSPS